MLTLMLCFALYASSALAGGYGKPTPTPSPSPQPTPTPSTSLYGSTAVQNRRWLDRVVLDWSHYAGV